MYEEDLIDSHQSNISWNLEGMLFYANIFLNNRLSVYLASELKPLL